jgi:hypothetical protein
MTEHPDWPEIGILMSNFDCKVDTEVADRLRKEQVIASYTGYNFYAYCWFQDGLFHADVWLYSSHVDTMSAETPEELMKEVSDEFGWE